MNGQAYTWETGKIHLQEVELVISYNLSPYLISTKVLAHLYWVHPSCPICLRRCVSWRSYPGPTRYGWPRIVLPSWIPVCRCCGASWSRSWSKTLGFWNVGNGWGFPWDPVWTVGVGTYVFWMCHSGVRRSWFLGGGWWWWWWCVNHQPSTINHHHPPSHAHDSRTAFAIVPPPPASLPRRCMEMLQRPRCWRWPRRCWRRPRCCPVTWDDESSRWGYRECIKVEGEITPLNYRGYSTTLDWSYN